MLELLASGPGTGKTTYCIEQFKNEVLKSKSGIDSRSFFVLPSREHAERIQHLVLKKDILGLFNAHILTFNDLAARLGGRPGMGEPNEAVRQQILRGICESGPALPTFDACKDLPGFYRLLSDSLKEFRSSLLSIAEFEKRAQPLLKDAAFRAKFRDLSVVIKRYDLELEKRGLSEPERAIAELLTLRLKPDQADLVVFDGFYHFSRAQSELVRAVSRAARRTIVTLTTDRARKELFYYGQRTRAFLLSCGFKESAAASGGNRRAQHPELLHLSEELFKAEPCAYRTAPERIRVLEAPDAHGEIERIAREVRILSRDQSLYLSDICVILRSVSPYQAMIESVFARYGVPVHVHERRRLKDTAAAVYLHRFLSLMTGQWSREDLMTLLRSLLPEHPVPIEETLKFERLAVSCGLRQGREAWLKLAKTGAPPEAARRVRELAERENEFKAAKNARARAAVLEALAAELQAPEPAERKALEEFLRRARDLEGGLPEELQGLIATALFSDKPRGKNRVQVYDAVMALPKEYKVVFVAGLLEKAFPQAVSEDALLKDHERRVINGADSLLEERLPRAYGEQYFFYMAVTRARERVYLSYPLYDAEGRRCLPSFFVDEVRKCFAAKVPTETRPPDEFLPGPQEWETVSEVVRGLAERRDLLEALPGWTEHPGLRRAVSRAGKDELDARLTDPRALEQIAASRGPYSATRLEQMAACAYRYFAEQTLGLKDSPEGREAIEMGLALHATLEAYFESLTAKSKRSGEHLKDLPAAKRKLKQLLEPIAARSALARGRPYRFAAQLHGMRGYLEAFAEREKALFKRRGWAPRESELKFTDPKFLTIDAPGGAIRLRGQIDRIDVSPDGRQALVVDYKLSRRHGLADKVQGGLELQLPIYMLAARRLLGLEVVGAEHRYLRKPEEQGVYRGDVKDALGLNIRKGLFAHDEFEAMLARCEQTVRALVARIQNGDISVRSRSCKYCAMAPVCRFEKWRLVYSGDALDPTT